MFENKSDMENKVITINYSNIFDYLEDRIPYVFVDSAEVMPAKSAKGYKMFTISEWYFPLHLPGDPLVPAAFQLEAITQMTGLAIQVLKDELKSRKIYVKKYYNIDLYEPVRPGCKLYIDTEILKFRRGIISACGTAYSYDEENNKILHCKAEFQMVMPDVIQSFAPQKINRDL